jgi:hypothetical protein
MAEQERNERRRRARRAFEHGPLPFQQPSTG